MVSLFTCKTRLSGVSVSRKRQVASAVMEVSSHAVTVQRTEPTTTRGSSSTRMTISDSNAARFPAVESSRIQSWIRLPNSRS